MSPVPEWIAARRSIRSFADRPVDADTLRGCVEAACLAPAPHHSRPWRFVTLGPDGRRRLSEAMARAWRVDLGADGVQAERAEELCAASVNRIASAPAAVLGCLVWDGLDRYPDEGRRRAEWGMALLSLGAAVENLMLTAASHGLASCWIAAPIFCADTAASALDLGPEVQPQALVLLGHPDPSYVPRQRPPVPLDVHLTAR